MILRKAVITYFILGFAFSVQGQKWDEDKDEFTGETSYYAALKNPKNMEGAFGFYTYKLEAYVNKDIKMFGIFLNFPDDPIPEGDPVRMEFRKEDDTIIKFVGDAGEAWVFPGVTGWSQTYWIVIDKSFDTRLLSGQIKAMRIDSRFIGAINKKQSAEIQKWLMATLQKKVE